MEPQSIIGLLSTAGTVASTITLTIKSLSELRGQYKDADVRIRLLIGELSTVKSALNQIHDWTHYLDDIHKQSDVVDGLRVSLDGCQLAMDTLAEEVRSLLGGTMHSSLSPGFRTKTRYVWNESTLNEHEYRLRALIAALQLLLQAVQCNAKPEQVELLHKPENQQIIQRVADDTSTLRATRSQRSSQVGPPTIVSHDDSTIDGKIFEWDDEIVNADTYRRAMNHARSKSDMVAKRTERDEGLDTLSQAGTEESCDRLSPVESQRQKPLPYEMSVVSEPLYSQQGRVVVPHASFSDKTSSRRSIVSYRQKTPDADKKSLWSTISGKRGSRNLAPPERNGTPNSPGSSITTPGSRRGRRGFENTYHTSIDFGSEDGLSAPPIVRAAQAGSVVEVEMLLDQRADINARHRQSGRSALSVASHCGNEEVVRLLLQYGALVNERDASLLTPLHLASMRGHVDVVESLLQERADLEAKGPDDQTPLRVASEKGQIEVAEVLLRKRAKVNARDKSQLTPLHVAAKHGDEAMTELLVSNGAHVEVKDGSFMGPIHYACEGGHTRVVANLLNKKANIEAPGKASMTPLLCAASSGQINVIELLLKKKASLKHKGEGEMTALHWASFNGHVEVVDLLLQKRAPVATTNKDGRTSLHLAVLAEQFAVADLLLRKGAPIEAQCKSMLKPIHYACRAANPEITQLLLGYNANIEAEDSTRDRPLHIVCTRGSYPHVQLLIQRGVSIDARNNNGDRPLCLASSMGHVDIVRALLDRGAALRSKFSTGPSHEDSPLCLAAKNGHVAVVQELLTRGVSVLQKDEHNWQPLRYAAFNAHPDIVELLLRHGATISGSASGGWGFNITARRIGFANDVTNEEQRKGQVLRLLTSAEEREQKTQERAASAAAPLVPPAVQNQASPTELPDPGIASPTAKIPRPAPPPLPPRATPEMNAEPNHSPNSASTLQPRYTYDPTQPPVNSLAVQGLLPQQTQRIYSPSSPVEPAYLDGTSISTTSTRPLENLMPLGQSYYNPQYSNYIPGPVPSPASMQPQTPPSPAPYNFVPKTIPPSTPSNVYSPAMTSQSPPGMSNAYAAPPSTQGTSAMTIGPDGLWQQVPPPGVQRAVSRSSINQHTTTPIASPSYPTGVYEMAS